MTILDSTKEILYNLNSQQESLILKVNKNQRLNYGEDVKEVDKSLKEGDLQKKKKRHLNSQKRTKLKDGICDTRGKKLCNVLCQKLTLYKAKSFHTIF